MLSDTDELMATLRLSNPVAAPAIDGKIEFNAIRPGIAVSSGEAETARIIAADGSECLYLRHRQHLNERRCDQTQHDGDRAGKPVRIDEFSLRMP